MSGLGWDAAKTGGLERIALVAMLNRRIGVMERAAKRHSVNMDEAIREAKVIRDDVEAQMHRDDSDYLEGRI